MVVNPNFLLLNSQITCNQIVNVDYLTNIWPAASTPVTIHYNAGKMLAATMANFGITPVCYNEGGISNVLSLKKLGEWCHHFTCDSWNRGGVFVIHTSLRVVKFHLSPHGLHYLNMTDNSDSAILLVNAVHVQPIIPTIQSNFTKTHQAWSVPGVSSPKTSRNGW